MVDGLLARSNHEARIALTARLCIRPIKTVIILASSLSDSASLKTIWHISHFKPCRNFILNSHRQNAGRITRTSESAKARESTWAKGDGDSNEIDVSDLHPENRTGQNFQERVEL
jgi:hypothetical protein